METMVQIVIGVFISILGIINIRGNINTIHAYNRRNVREEDILPYGKMVGTGTLIIGAAFTIASIASLWIEALMTWITVPSVVIGLAFILYGQFRYNKGIF